MKASNLGVVFGPTLMRSERVSVAAIVDIKHQNVIVELMIEEMEKVSWSRKEGKEIRKEFVEGACILIYW